MGATRTVRRMGIDFFFGGVFFGVLAAVHVLGKAGMSRLGGPTCRLVARLGDAGRARSCSVAGQLRTLGVALYSSLDDSSRGLQLSVLLIGLLP